MDMTVGPLQRLEALANATATTSILDVLRFASLAPNDVAIMGTLVSFLAAPERTRCLDEWSAEAPLARELARLGEAAWADAGLLTSMRPISDAHLASRQMHGKVETHYLAAMAAARRANHRAHPVEAPFLEQLRLLLIVRALEATMAGIPSETYLEGACMRVRHAADKDHDQAWGWIARIAHTESASLDSFVRETQSMCERTLLGTDKPALSASGRVFMRDLGAVLAKERKAKKDRGSRTFASIPSTVPRQRSADRDNHSAFAGAEAGAVVDLSDDNEQDGLFLVVDVDPGRPPPAQRVRGNGLILQSIEHVQFLRHSWHRLSQLEEPLFFERLDEMRSSNDLQDQLGGVLVGVAVLASMPLSRVLDLTIQRSLTDDWSIDLSEGCLHRRPARSSRRWRSGPEVKGWVAPLADEWRINLSAPTLAVLRSVKVRGGSSAAAVWDGVSPDRSLHSWFGERFATVDVLSRLTSPVVGNILSQQVFGLNRDHAQARLVTSASRTALPAACIYGSFNGAEVNAGLSSALDQRTGVVPPLVVQAGCNAAGSELDVDIGRLRGAIRALTDKVDAAATHSDRWVEHHNLLTALSVVALLASTGGRMVKSCFESRQWLDLERRLVYIEDKRSGPTSGSRVCVLSEAAHRLLVDRYLPHLESLQQALGPRLPKFAEQVGRVHRGEPDCMLPLFFFLRADPDIDWSEVSETQLDMVCKNPWPLPWNLFRHLHSTLLRRRGLPPDVRDALLSHGERGAESHGDLSWRTPNQDFDLARPHVDALSRDLGFALPRQSLPAVLGAGAWRDLDFSQRPPFGRRARKNRREVVHAAARRNAHAEIERWLGCRPPSSLSSSNWDEIAKLMILRDDGLRHAQASLRCAVLEDYLTALWRTHRVRVPMLRRYLPIGEGRAWFTEDAVNVPGRLADLKLALDAIELNRTPGPDTAGCLAALELALNCRVSNFAVLSAVVRNRSSVELVRFRQRYWLEVAYQDQWKDGRPVYRVPITERAAAWIDMRRDARKRLESFPPIPALMQGFGGLETKSLEVLLREVGDLVFQANALELPGAMAAMLHGSRESAALPHGDWIRVSSLQAPDIESVDVSEGEPAAHEEVATFFTHHSRSSAIKDGEELARCTALIDAIQEILSSESGVTTKSMAANVQRLVKQSGFGKGDGPYVLAHYVYHLLTRRKKGKASTGLKASTALRYWYALKAGILEFAFDCHLPALDDEELTELYQQIVDAAEAPARDLGRKQTGASKRRQLKPDSDVGKRALVELRLFHAFAQEIYGLADVDWTEISPGITAGSGRPGIVLMAEYEAVLSTLASADNCSALDEDTLASALVLIACARFGLRVGEAVGMHRDDWVEIAGSTVVLVRSNATRSLKTEASKRQVPLVGQLGPVEQAVAREAFRRWLGRSDPRVSSALLAGVEPATFVAHRNKNSKRLLLLIKAVTGNSTSMVHHLRHGFACRLLVLLHGRPYGAGLPCSEDDSLAARRLLLQGDTPDRRTLWAVARMLGHSSPATTIKSYLHLLDEWLPSLPKRSGLFSSTVADRCVDLDRLPKSDRISALMPVALDAQAAPETLFHRHMQYLRLRAIGNRNADEEARLSASEKRRLDDAVNLVAQRLQGAAAGPSSSLLGRVPEQRWRALIAMAKTVVEVPPPMAAAAWIPTVGASGQVLLFLQVHLSWVALFMKGLHLTKLDCCLNQSKRPDSALLHHASEAGLDSLLVPPERASKHLQIDRAVEGSPERIYTHRIAMRPVPGGLLATSYELLLLWTAWLAAASQAEPVA